VRHDIALSTKQTFRNVITRYMQEYQLSFSHFLRIFSFGHGILCRRCKQPLCDHELEFYFAEVCVSIKSHTVRHLKMCLPHFKNFGSTRQSLLQREMQECQQVAPHAHSCITWLGVRGAGGVVVRPSLRFFSMCVWH
jgi:hypothetical protein